MAGSILPQELFPGVLATSISGLLTIKSGQNKLHPLPRPSAKHLWGRTNAQLLVGALQEVSDTQYDLPLTMYIAWY